MLLALEIAVNLFNPQLYTSYMVAEKVDLPSPAHHRRLERRPRIIGDWNLTRAPSVIQSPHTIDDWSIARTPSAIGTSRAHHRGLEPRPLNADI